MTHSRDKPRPSGRGRCQRPISRAVLEAYQDRLQALIAEHGYIVQGVLSKPPFSYTVGLHQTHHLPELVMVGLDPSTMHSVLNDVARKLIAGLELNEGHDYAEVFEQFPARFRKLDCASVVEHLHLCPEGTQAWQLLWPDPAGRFPGDPAMDPSYRAMQLLELAHAGGGQLH